MLDGDGFAEVGADDAESTDGAGAGSDVGVTLCEAADAEATDGATDGATEGATDGTTNGAGPGSDVGVPLCGAGFEAAPVQAPRNNSAAAMPDV